MKDELPEFYWPYFDNYTGPYWSDAKFQASVKSGKSKPATRLDILSKRHDEQYASCGDDDNCLNAADDLYYEDSRGMSLGPRFIGTLPKLINRPIRNTKRLVGGLVEKMTGLGDFWDILTGDKEKERRRKVNEYEQQKREEKDYWLELQRKQEAREREEARSKDIQQDANAPVVNRVRDTPVMMPIQEEQKKDAGMRDATGIPGDTFKPADDAQAIFDNGVEESRVVGLCYDPKFRSGWLRLPTPKNLKIRGNKKKNRKIYSM